MLCLQFLSVEVASLSALIGQMAKQIPMPHCSAEICSVQDEKKADLPSAHVLAIELLVGMESGNP